MTFCFETPVPTSDVKKLLRPSKRIQRAAKQDPPESQPSQMCNIMPEGAQLAHCIHKTCLRIHGDETFLSQKVHFFFL